MTSTKSKEEICECGHKEFYHYIDKGKDRGKCGCRFLDCPCKKFKAGKSQENNHNPEDVQTICPLGETTPDFDNEDTIQQALSKIKPTKEEVNLMTEDEWTNNVYPVRCFQVGQQEQKKKFERVIDECRIWDILYQGDKTQTLISKEELKSKLFGKEGEE